MDIWALDWASCELKRDLTLLKVIALPEDEEITRLSQWAFEAIVNHYQNEREISWRLRASLLSRWGMPNPLDLVDYESPLRGLRIDWVHGRFEAQDLSASVPGQRFWVGSSLCLKEGVPGAPLALLASPAGPLFLYQEGLYPLLPDSAWARVVPGAVHGQKGFELGPFPGVELRLEFEERAVGEFPWDDQASEYSFTDGFHWLVEQLDLSKPERRAAFFDRYTLRDIERGFWAFGR
jgi:hypothetical protein